MQDLVDKLFMKYLKWAFIMSIMMTFPPIAWEPPADHLIAKMRSYAFEALFRLDPMNPKNLRKHSLENFTNQLTGKRSELVYGKNNMHLDSKKNRKLRQKKHSKR